MEYAGIFYNIPKAIFYLLRGDCRVSGFRFVADWDVSAGPV